MGQGSMVAGRAPPWDINVVVEIPLRGTGVDAGDAAGRFRADVPCHPGNYGFVPDTLMPDGEPCEALVVGSVSVLPGAILRSRPIGIIELADDDDGSGLTRLLAVPLERLHPFYAGTTSYRSLPAGLLDEITEFFINLHDCDRSRPLRLARWGEAEEAAQIMEAAIAKHRAELSCGKNR